MFYLVAVRSKEETKIYSAGDTLCFILGGISTVKYTGKIDYISDSGVVTVVDITMATRGKSVNLDSVFKLETVDMSECVTLSRKVVLYPMAILDECGVKSVLMTKQKGLKFKENSNITVEVLTDIKREVYVGEYLGLNSKNELILKDCKCWESLNILKTSRHNGLSLVKEENNITIDIEKINKVWYTGNSQNKYSVEVARSRVG